MIALLLSLYRVFGKREIKEENEREYARMPVRARENTTQHFKADGLSGCQLFIFPFSSDRFPYERFCCLQVVKDVHDCFHDRPCGCKVWNATAKVCYRIRYQGIKVYTL